MLAGMKWHLSADDNRLWYTPHLVVFKPITPALFYLKITILSFSLKYCFVLKYSNVSYYGIEYFIVNKKLNNIEPKPICIVLN